MSSAVDAQSLQIALEGWHEEQRSAYLYAVLAEVETDARIRQAFAQLSEAAKTQSGTWLELARRNGAQSPRNYAPDGRTRLVAWMIRRLGPRNLRGVLAAMKIRGMSLYASPGHAMPESVDEVGLRHAGVHKGGALRAAVFGINDGLISNASLMLGIAGASAEQGIIVLSGFAGLLAGAFSMAAGEYVSVRSQREMYEHQIGLEREELKLYPEEEARELALIYGARGLSNEDAQVLADKMIRNPEQGLAALSREELGLNPDELGSPWEAASASFAAFAIGAVVPVVPFLLGRGRSALLLSIGLSALALFGIGMLLSLFTGQGAWKSGLRMLMIGAVSGACAYGIGTLLGVTLV